MIAGTLPSKKPVSLMIATSAARRSRLASSHASRWTRARLLLALEHVLDVDRQRAARRQERLGRHQVERGSGPCRRRRRGRASGRRRRPARTAATSRGRAGRPAGRRSGRRRGRSGRPRRAASRRRRPGGRRSRTTSTCSSPAAVSASASQSAARRQSPACAGSAEMLGMRRNSLYDVEPAPRGSRRDALRGRRRVVGVGIGRVERRPGRRRGRELNERAVAGPLVGRSDGAGSGRLRVRLGRSAGPGR